MIFRHQPSKAIVFLQTILVLSGLSVAMPALARSYDVEIIIFEHVRKTDVGASDALLLPVIRGAKPIPPAPTIDQSAEQTAAGLAPSSSKSILPIQALPSLRLQEQAKILKGSNNHRVLYHGGWRQLDFDQETAPYMRIALGRPVSIHTEPGDADSLYLTGFSTPPLNSAVRYDEKRTTTLYGGIKVWVGRFLHFDTLLSYTPRGGDRSFALKSERRMRSRQLHYIDNPRIGIITKIFPVDETAPN